MAKNGWSHNEQRLRRTYVFEQVSLISVAAAVDLAIELGCNADLCGMFDVLDGIRVHTALQSLAASLLLLTRGKFFQLNTPSSQQKLGWCLR